MNHPHDLLVKEGFSRKSAAVFNLSKMPDERITGIPYLRILLLTLKHIHHPQLPKKLGEIAVIFRELNGESEAKGYLSSSKDDSGYYKNYQRCCDWNWMKRATRCWRKS